MVTPAFVYAIFNTAINVGVLAYGPASKIVMFGPLLAILQLYMCIFPLFLPVPQVCHLDKHMWATCASESWLGN